MENEKKSTQIENETVLELDIEKIGKEIKKNKKIPNGEIEKLKRKVFLTFFTSGIVMFVFIFILMGYTNIALPNYLLDLKVFSCIAIAITIVVFEYAYKKDSGSIAIVGIESLIAAIVILSLYYILQYNVYPYKAYLITMVCIFMAYYLLKIIIILIKDLYKSRKKANDIKNIIKKEEI